MDNIKQLTDDDFISLDKLFKEGFIAYVANNVGVTIVKHGYKLYDNKGLIVSGFTKAPRLALYLDTEYFDPVEVNYYLGMGYLNQAGFTNDYVGEIVLDYVSDYLEVYPLSDLD